MSDPLADLDGDPALAAVVLEIETHLSHAGWDQPARLYALVDTARLVSEEPALAAELGLDASAQRGSLTPIEQEVLSGEQPLEEVLETIGWPDAVAGCAVMMERLVLPPGAEVALPEDAVAARAVVAEHPDRQEVRIVAGVTRAGATYCALRQRAHDDPSMVMGGVDLVPGLLRLLATTLDPDPDSQGPDSPGPDSHGPDSQGPAEETP